LGEKGGDRREAETSGRKIGLTAPNTERRSGEIDRAAKSPLEGKPEEVKERSGSKTPEGFCQTRRTHEKMLLTRGKSAEGVDEGKNPLAACTRKANRNRKGMDADKGESKSKGGLFAKGGEADGGKQGGMFGIFEESPETRMKRSAGKKKGYGGIGGKKEHLLKEKNGQWRPEKLP